MPDRLRQICYWCGISVENEKKQREHVPALGFFPTGHRVNLITVPACQSHNSMLSKIDEEFLLYIKSSSNSQIALDDVRGRIFPALRRKQAAGFAEQLRSSSFYTTIDGERSPAVGIRPGHMQKFLEKIIRGLYFYHHGIPATGNVNGMSPSFPNKDFNVRDSCDRMLEVLREFEFTDGHYSNPQIFKYAYITFPDINYFFVIMQFYESVEFIGWVAPF